MQKFVTIAGIDYMVAKADSIFSSRIGRQDICIRVRGRFGGRYGESKYNGYYRTARIIDAENMEIVRDYEKVPVELNCDVLRELGFLN